MDGPGESGDNGGEGCVWKSAENRLDRAGTSLPTSSFLVSFYSFSVSSSCGRGKGVGGVASVGHWPISAFSNATGWEKSARLWGENEHIPYLAHTHTNTHTVC